MWQLTGSTPASDAAADKNVEFPIVVTLYLLTSFQRSMDRFTDQLSELVKELQQQRHMIH